MWVELMCKDAERVIWKGHVHNKGFIKIILMSYPPKLYKKNIPVCITCIYYMLCGILSYIQYKTVCDPNFAYDRFSVFLLLDCCITGSCSYPHTNTK